jgi:hypothetical protein
MHPLCKVHLTQLVETDDNRLRCTKCDRILRDDELIEVGQLHRSRLQQAAKNAGVDPDELLRRAWLSGEFDG